MSSRAGQVLKKRSDRVADAWRKLRLSQLRPGEPPTQVLEDVVEPFVRELGASLDGQRGSPWARTSGVLRLSRTRGTREVTEEFGTLRRCLEVSLEVLSASPDECRRVAEALDEACSSAVQLQQSLDFPEPTRARAPAFGGVVLEVFDHAPAASSTSDADAMMQ